MINRGFPDGTVVKNLPANAGDIKSRGLTSGSGRSPGESHEQRDLAGYSPWGCKELDTTEATNTSSLRGASAVLL